MLLIFDFQQKASTEGWTLASGINYSETLFSRIVVISHFFLIKLRITLHC